MKHGFAGHIGEGKSVESQIHVNDLACGYQTLLRYVEGLEQNGGDLVRNPYFFCENDKEFSWYEVADNIGHGLKSAGRIEDGSPQPIPEDLWADLFVSCHSDDRHMTNALSRTRRKLTPGRPNQGPETGGIVGLNSRSRAVRLRALGWEAQEKGIWESFQEDELPVILARADEGVHW
jgi:hypothetical protein